MSLQSELESSKMRTMAARHRTVRLALHCLAGAHNLMNRELPSASVKDTTVHSPLLVMEMLLKLYLGGCFA